MFFQIVLGIAIVGLAADAVLVGIYFKDAIKAKRKELINVGKMEEEE